ncbi:MAG: hypothetical protein NTZ68_00015 [Candidatus Dependentiae bacterium]|nr:hypothetical protein [Candidatus Dependentiae bacterium]
MKNLKSRPIKTLSILAMLACSGQAFAMMQHGVSQMVAPVAAAVLLTQKRFLCGNQASDPVWIKANHQVELFRKKHNIPKVDSVCLDAISTAIDQELWKKLADDNDQDSVDLMRPIVEPLVEKHGLDVSKISIIVPKNPISHSIASAGGNALIFKKNFLNWTPAWQKAAIEHELGHVVCYDSAYKVLGLASLSSDAGREYTLLIERRADTHSALQSLQNSKSLIDIHSNNGSGWADILKKHELLVCLRDETLDKFTKAKKIKYLLEKPTYLEELLDYMAKKENEKVSPIIHL